VWFKRKQTCAHCGKAKTHRLFEDRPTCPECEIGLKIAREPKRTCPVDRTVMHKEHSGEIILDRCPVCQGVWFDASELETLKAAAQNDDRFAQGFVLGMIVG
jgi:DnaJ-class molecular chaperone